MRSRYSAYALGLTDYIIETTHPDNPHYQQDLKTWKNELDIFSKSCRFGGLRINEFVAGETAASVSFTADLQCLDEDASFTENSQFVKENGKWFYRSGEPEQ
ncbi:MAG TPA: YchJ family metal-binding protein, partial [Chroococcales cyanobacterium]